MDSRGNVTFLCSLLIIFWHTIDHMQNFNRLIVSQTSLQKKIIEIKSQICEFASK